jgi:hypothetical protein
MSWADVVGCIDISTDTNNVPYSDSYASKSAFDAPTAAQIWDLLAYLYENSPAAQKMLALEKRRGRRRGRYYLDSRFSSSISVSRAGGESLHCQSTRFRSSFVAPGAKLRTSIAR